jgi:hypothetical protein
MRLSRTPPLVLGLVLVGVVVPALAQQTTGYGPACDDAKVTKFDRDRAHTVFLSGKQYLEESNYDKAISYFKDAYSIDCSVHGILPIIATAYERKGDKREAVRALEEYQKRAPSAPDHEVIERRIKNLKDQIGQEPPPPTAASSAAVAPPVTATSAEPLPPPPATGPTVVATEPPVASGHSVAPWIVTGIGGALVAGGVVAYVVGAGKVSNAEQHCGPSHTNCPDGSPAIDDGNEGRSLELVGSIVGGVGVAAVAAGLIWHFTERPVSGTSGALRVDPVAGPGYAGLSVGGAF